MDSLHQRAQGLRISALGSRQGLQVSALGSRQGLRVSALGSRQDFTHDRCRRFVGAQKQRGAYHAHGAQSHGAACNACRSI